MLPPPLVEAACLHQQVEADSPPYTEEGPPMTPSGDSEDTPRKPLWPPIPPVNDMLPPPLVEADSPPYTEEGPPMTPVNDMLPPPPVEAACHSPEVLVAKGVFWGCPQKPQKVSLAAPPLCMEGCLPLLAAGPVLQWLPGRGGVVIRGPRPYRGARVGQRPRTGPPTGAVEPANLGCFITSVMTAAVFICHMRRRLCVAEGGSASPREATSQAVFGGNAAVFLAQ
ncbi:unnamed protein product [Gadus morhua 'NCC']